MIKGIIPRLTIPENTPKYPLTKGSGETAGISGVKKNPPNAMPIQLTKKAAITMIATNFIMGNSNFLNNPITAPKRVPIPKTALEMSDLELCR